MDLKADDYVGVSFWIISAAMVAATYFFTVERDRAEGKWKTSLTVAAMVTGIAAIHYFYMRGVWVSTGESPLVFRYVDWLLTVPLQIIEFRRRVRKKRKRGQSRSGRSRTLAR